ncbi:MAG: hypothetical protein JW936_04640 [Sedimentisphaerales bacterium]|nr:hypothetical protein [Sedimentisphaerales bacterium]
MKRLVCIFLGLTLGFLMGGCDPEDQIDEQFIANSPFRSQSHTDISEIHIITCTYHAFEISANVDAVSWLREAERSSVQTDSAEAGDSQNPPASQPIRFSTSGFNNEQTRNWQNNGLYVAALPNEDWQQLRERIIASNAITLPMWQGLIRRSDAIMELPLGTLQQATSVFVSDCDGGLRGYSLPAGKGIMRLNATIEEFSPRRRVYFEVVPVVQSSDVDEEFGQDEQGTLRLLTRNPEILFDQLRLGGILEDNWSICIVAESAGSRIDSIGQILMANQSASENRQIVVLITLEIQTGQELQSTVQ